MWQTSNITIGQYQGNCRTSYDVASIQHHRNVVSATVYGQYNITVTVQHCQMWPTSNITRMFLKLRPTLHGSVEHPKMWHTSQGIQYRMSLLYSSHRSKERGNTEISIYSECTQTEQCLGTSISMILLTL
jgi:hypothetical protein